MSNYFNKLPLRRKLSQLSRCRPMARSEFADGVNYLKDSRIVVLGCGAQGLNQALCLRDSGLQVAIALRPEAIAEKRPSWRAAVEHNLPVNTAEQLVPNADLVLNLTPDKQHAQVIDQVMPMMKDGACLSYSHGFNIVEEGQQIRDSLCVILVAPKAPGSELREEYLRDFGVPTLISVHEENDPNGDGIKIASAYAAGIGADRAGVLQSSFVAEVKSDLMGEQTILCGMLQTGSLLCFERMVKGGIAADYASGLVQYGWEVLGEALKFGGLTNMMNRLSNPAKIRACEIADELKTALQSLYESHMDGILNGDFSAEMISDWKNDDRRLLNWRQQIAETRLEQTQSIDRGQLPEQAFFDHGILMAAMIKAGVELAFEVMISAGMKKESAYYESLHELPLIANLIARNKLYEMNRVISDTAEYGCHLFSETAMPLLKPQVDKVGTDVIGSGTGADNRVDNRELIAVNEALANHPVEQIGRRLRRYMTSIKNIL